VGSQALAPVVRRWHVEERWQEEDYCNGFPAAGPDWTTFMRAANEYFIPLIAQTIFISPTEKVGTLAYIGRLNEELSATQNRISNDETDALPVNALKHFLDGIVDRLRLAGERSIWLGRSHGNFVPRHVLVTKHRFVLVDWDASGIRSALFDLYDVFFSWLGSKSPRPYMADMMRGAIAHLQSWIARHTGANNNSLVSSLCEADVYRWIYYLERGYQILGRADTADTPTELQLSKQLRRMARYVDRFSLYEKMLSEHDV
jgi:hypothetical protein